MTPSSPSRALVCTSPTAWPALVHANPLDSQPVKVKKASCILFGPVYTPSSVSPVHVTFSSCSVSSRMGVDGLDALLNRGLVMSFVSPLALGPKPGYHSNLSSP